MKNTLMVWVVGLFVLIGCSSPQAANKSNFKSAIQEYYDKYPPYVQLLGGVSHQLPLMLTDGGYDLGAIERMEVFRRLGFVDREEGTVERNDMWGQQTITKTQYKYTLTEKGKKYYTDEVEPPVGFGKNAGFIIGKLRVTKINKFTAPASIMGVIASQVEFETQLTDIPDWVHDKKLNVLDQSLQDYFSKSDLVTTKTAAVVKTSEGWVHEWLLY